MHLTYSNCSPGNLVPESLFTSLCILLCGAKRLVSRVPYYILSAWIQSEVLEMLRKHF